MSHFELVKEYIHILNNNYNFPNESNYDIFNSEPFLIRKKIILIQDLLEKITISFKSNQITDMTEYLAEIIYIIYELSYIIGINIDQITNPYNNISIINPSELLPYDPNICIDKKQRIDQAIKNINELILMLVLYTEKRENSFIDSCKQLFEIIPMINIGVDISDVSIVADELKNPIERFNKISKILCKILEHCYMLLHNLRFNINIIFLETHRSKMNKVCIAKNNII